MTESIGLLSFTYFWTQGRFVSFCAHYVLPTSFQARQRCSNSIPLRIWLVSDKGPPATARCVVISTVALTAWSWCLVRGDHGPIQKALAPLMTPLTVLPFALINAFRASWIRFCVPWRLYPENFVGGRNVHPRQWTSTPRLKDVRVPIYIWTYESWINIANFESKSDGSSSLPRKRLSSACSFWVPVLQGKPQNPWLWWRMSLVLAS